MLAPLLLFFRPMCMDPRIWRRLTPETVAGLPEAAAIFEVANLVRTVLFIGAAGDLKTRLTTYVAEQVKHSACPGGFYVRYELVDSAEEALTARLAAYRSAHAGLLPPANREASPALRLAARHAA
jgi:hypothetical protein